jgi:carbon monoxide dehydrogenase subunit G
MSVSVDNALEIKRPLEEVFAYLADIGRQPEWSPAVVEVKQEAFGPVGKGTTYHQTFKMLGSRATNKMEVSDYESDRVIGFRTLSGPMKFHWRMELEPTADGGTRIRSHMEGQAEGVFKVAAPLLRGALQRQADGDFQNLKDLLESEVRTSP